VAAVDAFTHPPSLSQPDAASRGVSTLNGMNNDSLRVRRNARIIAETTRDIGEIFSTASRTRGQSAERGLSLLPFERERLQ